VYPLGLSQPTFSKYDKFIGARVILKDEKFSGVAPTLGGMRCALRHEFKAPKLSAGLPPCGSQNPSGDIVMLFRKPVWSIERCHFVDRFYSEPFNSCNPPHLRNPLSGRKNGSKK